MHQCTFHLRIAILISSVGFPRDLMPILHVARIMVGTFSTDVWHVNNMNLLLAPLHVLSNWMQKEPKAEALEFMFMIIAEVFFISITALILSTLHEKEYQLAAASLELEEKVQEVKEAERSGAAAQRLLAVTCDASTRLTGDLRISQPSPSLSDLLMCGFGSNLGCNHLEGVPFLRYVDPPEHNRLKAFIEESATADTPPRSIYLQMKDSSGISFNAELFHVTVPSLMSEQVEHLIGISQENSERVLASEEQSAMSGPSTDMPPTDMRHILGYGLPPVKTERSLPSARSRSKSRSESASSSDPRTPSSKCQNLIRLRMLQKVNFTIDIESDDFQIESLTLRVLYAMEVVALQLGTIPRQRLCQRESMQGYAVIAWCQTDISHAVCQHYPCRGSGWRYWQYRKRRNKLQWQRRFAHEHRDAEAFCPLAELGMMRCNAIGGVLDFSPKQQWLDQIIQSHGFETCGSGARCLASKSQLLYT